MKLQSLHRVFSTIQKQMYIPLGIELGTQFTRICTPYKRLAVNDYTALALDTKSKKILAHGKKVDTLTNQKQKDIEVYYPLMQGAIEQPHIAETLLRIYLKNIFTHPFFLRPRAVVAIPGKLTQVDIHMYTKTLNNAGVGTPTFVHQVLMAAIGSGIPTDEATGSLYLHIGAGGTEIALIRFGMVLLSQSSTISSYTFNTAIQRYLRKEHLIKVSYNQAEKIKRQVDIATEQNKEIQVIGSHVKEHTVVTKKLENTLLVQAYKKPLFDLIHFIKQFFSSIPADFVSDIVDKGVLLSGGGAKLTGLSEVLTQELKVPASVVEYPQLVVIQGLYTILHDKNMLERMKIE